MYPNVQVRPGKPVRHFKHLQYVGKLMNKKLRGSSQYYPELRDFPVDLDLHSQIGDGYNLAKLGSLDEFYDRLAKYDIDDVPLNRDVALMSINYFLDRIGSCTYTDVEKAYTELDFSKSIGFGAKESKIFARSDPRMKEYLFKYVELSSMSTHHCIVNASQKDEVRVSTKTPRLFTAFPPEHTFLATVVLGDFLRQFLKHRFCVDHSVSSVGDSIQNGAAAYYKLVLGQHPYLYCTDTSAQDSSVSPEFLNLVYDQIKLKYDFNQDDEMLFEAVRFNSIHKLVNANGDLYLVNRGLGSGDYLTIVINIIWRLYLILENYNHDLSTYFQDNCTVICGDDLAMSSKFSDLDLNSKYAKIEWAGRPVSWDEMDFCSVKFSPYIHHDANKVLAVLNNRKKRVHCLSPALELQRLGGILRVLSNKEIYLLVLSKMTQLVEDHPELEDDYLSLFVTYEELFSNYNSPFLYC